MLFIRIFQWICNPKNNALRLSPQWLCGNSCTWTHDEPYIMCPSARAVLVFVIGYIYYAHLALPL